jgi:hypothetical protein
VPPRGNPLSMDALQLYASDSDSDTGEFTARSLKKHRCQQVEDLIADRNAVHALPKQSPRRPLPSPPPEFLKSFPDLGTLAVLVLNPLFMFLFDSPVCKVFHFVCFCYRMILGNIYLCHTWGFHYDGFSVDPSSSSIQLLKFFLGEKTAFVL